MHPPVPSRPCTEGTGRGLPGQGQSAERLLGRQIPADWKLPDGDAAIEEWLKADGCYAALQHLGGILDDASGEDA